VTLAAGTLVEGKYRVEASIGGGAMGEVYVAVHERLGRRVAVKVLRPSLGVSDEAVKRFQREARAAARIGSRRIVDVIDAGELDSGLPFLVMEHLAGESLRHRLDRGPLPAREIVPIAIEILEGLAEAHDAGILHRDIKPDNVFITADDAVKLLDFGVCKLHGDVEGALTRTDWIMGTPEYVAPEQVLDSRLVDRRADLYGVGVILFEALAGRTPFAGLEADRLLVRAVLEDPPRLDTVASGVDRALADIVTLATAREREHRYGSARSMLRDLQAWQRGEPPEASRTIEAEAQRAETSDELTAETVDSTMAPDAQLVVATADAAMADVEPDTDEAVTDEAAADEAAADEAAGDVAEQPPRAARRPRWLLALLAAAALAAGALVLLRTVNDATDREVLHLPPPRDEDPAAAAESPAAEPTASPPPDRMESAPAPTVSAVTPDPSAAPASVPRARPSAEPPRRRFRKDI
jgi:eukaryotic-like serine/threonine-protein kinase